MWFAHRPEYGGKLLFIDEHARCSNHKHKIKTETFFCPEGRVILTVEGKKYDLNPMARGKTIFPGEHHTFWAEVQSVLIEASTHHEETDSYRLNVSQEGDGEKWEL